MHLLLNYAFSIVHFLWFQSWGACALINATVVPELLQSDSLRHGVPGKEGLCAQRSGSQEYFDS